MELVIKNKELSRFILKKKKNYRLQIDTDINDVAFYAELLFYSLEKYLSRNKIKASSTPDSFFAQVSIKTMNTFQISGLQLV